MAKNAEKNTEKKPGNPENIVALLKELNASFFEREDEINGLLVAMLAREHCLLLGLPGTAKSLLARAVCEALEGATFFQWLLSKFTTPEELFGPMSLKALEADSFKRVTKGKLPEAHIAFLDEIFKANSAILNSLLTIINERLFFNDGDVKVPLLSVVGASNELPESAELDALYDRFLLRYDVKYLKSRASQEALLMNGVSKAQTKLSGSDLKVLWNEVDSMPMTIEIVNSLLTIKEELEKAGIIVSDRRWVSLVRVVKAQAVLNRHSEVEDDDLMILVHCLWKTPEQISTIRDKVGAVASPLTAEATEIYDAARELYETCLKVEKENKGEFYSTAANTIGDLKAQKAKLEELIQASTSKSKSKAIRIVSLIDEMQIALRAKASKALM